MGLLSEIEKQTPKEEQMDSGVANTSQDKTLDETSEKELLISIASSTKTTATLLKIITISTVIVAVFCLLIMAND
jgi:hypothetical protein